jgi:hypothetical protein
MAAELPPSPSQEPLTRRKLRNYTNDRRRAEAHRQGRSTPSPSPDLHEYATIFSSQLSESARPPAFTAAAQVAYGEESRRITEAFFFDQSVSRQEPVPFTKPISSAQRVTDRADPSALRDTATPSASGRPRRGTSFRPSTKYAGVSISPAVAGSQPTTLTRPVGRKSIGHRGGKQTRDAAKLDKSPENGEKSKWCGHQSRQSSPARRGTLPKVIEGLPTWANNPLYDFGLYETTSAYLRRV